MPCYYVIEGFRLYKLVWSVAGAEARAGRKKLRGRDLWPIDAARPKSTRCEPGQRAGAEHQVNTKLLQYNGMFLSCTLPDGVRKRSWSASRSKSDHGNKRLPRPMHWHL